MPSDSRRSFLSRLPAVVALTAVSGCTALTSTDATIRFVNGYKYEETASFHVRDGNEQSEPETIALSPDEERVVTRPVRRGSTVVVTKANNELSFTLQRGVCLDPVLEVDIGGVIAGGWSC
jgi:hypothetical protein